MIDCTNVGLCRLPVASYPTLAPFDPPERFPEFQGRHGKLDPENEVYRAVRELLRHLEGDADRYGTPEWNPLRDLVCPGDLVVVKPNLIKEWMETDPNEWESVITHPSVVRAVCDYVALALGGTGEIIVCDAPQTDSSFTRILERTRLDEVVTASSAVGGVPVSLLDLRNEEWTSTEGVITARRRLSGDPRGTVALDLGDASEFSALDQGARPRVYYGADYDLTTINRHHEGGRHEYLVCRTPLQADVFINLPKLKTHKKTGVTLSLKNLVGINGDKNWLPHHSEGSPRMNGDQYPENGWLRTIERRLVAIARRVAYRSPAIGGRLVARARAAGTVVFGDSTRTIRAGNWHGNDTAWRMVVDLNKCLLYGRPDGTLRDPGGPRKRYFTVVDGVLAMDGNGPMQGDRKAAKLILGGCDPVAVDLVAVTAMGFDWRRLRIMVGALEARGFPISGVPPEQVRVRSNVPEWCGDLKHLAQVGVDRFRPHFGWLSAIERTTS